MILNFMGATHDAWRHPETMKDDLWSAAASRRTPWMTDYEYEFDFIQSTSHYFRGSMDLMNNQSLPIIQYQLFSREHGPDTSEDQH
jgi:hypothetical protein